MITVAALVPRSSPTRTAAWLAVALLDRGCGLNSAVLHGGLEGGVVAFVLVGVGFGEVGDRLIEVAGAAEVGGQGDAVAGAGVGAGQGPAAEPGVDIMPAGTICSIGAENFQSFSWRT